MGAPLARLLTPPARLPAAVGLAAFALYLLTIAPTISTARGAADSGELVSVASVLGVAHAPGYGPYLLLARGALEALPFIDEPALRTNLLSAALSATAVALLVVVVRRWRPGTPWWAAGAGAAVAATAPAFWSQAIVTEVYALQSLLSVLVLLATLRLHKSMLPPVTGRLDRQPLDGRAWVWWGLALGGLVANHPSGWLLALPLAAAVLLQRPPLRCLARTAVAFLLLPAGAAAYLLLRADAAIAWGDTDSLDGLWRHLSGRDYRNLWEWSLSEFVRTLPGSVREVLRQTPPPAWPLLPVGALAAWRARPPLAGALLAQLLAVVLLVTVYRAEGREAYYGPLALALGLFTAHGLAAAQPLLAAALPPGALPGGTIGRRAVLALGGGLAAVALAWMVATGFDVSQRGERSAEHAARAALEAAEPGGLLRVDADELTFPLWYLHTVRGVRGDVTIEDVRGLAPVLPGEPTLGAAVR